MEVDFVWFVPNLLRRQWVVPALNWFDFDALVTRSAEWFSMFANTNSIVPIIGWNNSMTLFLQWSYWKLMQVKYTYGIIWVGGSVLTCKSPSFTQNTMIIITVIIIFLVLIIVMTIITMFIPPSFSSWWWSWSSTSSSSSSSSSSCVEPPKKKY